MLTNNEINEIKERVWEPLKDISICVLLLGSHTINFIEKPEDIDIAIVCDSIENYQKIWEFIYRNPSLNGWSFKSKYNYCIKILNVNDNTNDFSYKYHAVYAYYMKHFYKIILGEMIVFPVSEVDQALSNLSELRIKIKEELLEPHIRFEPKWWYHIYISMCFIKNNSFNLDLITEEDKKIINILHNSNRNLTTEIRTYVKDCLNFFEISEDEFINLTPQYKKFFSNNKLDFSKELILKQQKRLREYRHKRKVEN